MQLIKNLHIGKCASLAQLWAQSCYGFGWKPNKDEGKIMGMAGNGQYDSDLNKMLKSVISYGGIGSLNFLPPGNPALAIHLIDSLSICSNNKKHSGYIILLIAESSNVLSNH